MSEDQYSLFESTEHLRLPDILEALVDRGIVRINGNSPIPKRLQSSKGLYQKGSSPEPKVSKSESITDLASKVAALLGLDLSSFMVSTGRVKVNDVLSSYRRLKIGDP